MSTLALFDDTIEAFVMPAAPPPKPRGQLVDGYVKTFQDTGESPLPTLQVIAGDGNEYRPALFELAPGMTLAQWELSRCWGVRVPGEKDLICMYDACRRGLAWETNDATQ